MVPTVRSDAGATGIVFRRGLFDRLSGAGRVVVLSAPPGSGKTVLLRSWIRESGLSGQVAWTAVQGASGSPQHFWIRVADALRSADAGSVVRPLSPAPELDAWPILERLLEDLASLSQRTWLVIDDVHELREAETLRQLELMLMRAPENLRFVLATRHDLRVGLHRLRLEGALTEIRSADLRFTQDEARALFEGAGVNAPDSVLAQLHARCEGWVAGLRLAALSLVGHPDPERFAAEFSGTGRTVAEYLLAEVLESQPPPAKRLLLRTSILDRISGPLADLLTGGSGSERILQELEEVNAFVVSIDASRSWFRYHQLFADLLKLELRGTAAGEVPALHVAAARWYEDHGFHVEAIRHAQAAEDWELATNLLLDHWFDLLLSGETAIASELLQRFTPAIVAVNPELAPLRALMSWRGSLADVERQVELAAASGRSVPEDRRSRLEVLVALLRLLLSRQRGDHATVVREAGYLAATDTAGAVRLWSSGDVRAFALVNLGTSEYWAGDFDDANGHLEEGIALAQRIDRPYLEAIGLTYLGLLALNHSFALAAERELEALELLERNGWTGDLVAAHAYAALGVIRVWQARLDETEQLLALAERALKVERQPVTGMLLYYVRGLLELARGHDREALAAFRTAERLVGLVEVKQVTLVGQLRAFTLFTLARLGDTQAVAKAFSRLDARELNIGENRMILAALRLAQGKPREAVEALESVLEGSAPAPMRLNWRVEIALLAAFGHNVVGEAAAAERALERALDLAERDAILLPFLLHPVPDLLERHLRRSSHAALIREILNLRQGSGAAEPARLLEPLSESETRVLRYLPTNLSVPEIAGEVYLSVNTVKTHMRHLYSKLGAHSRRQVVERARGLGLLAPSASGSPYRYR